MYLLFKIYHEVRGVNADIGKFPYSITGSQNIIKKVNIAGIDNESATDEENQDGIPYVSNSFETKIHKIAFIIQATEIDFWLSLKNMSHVYIVDENLVEYRLIDVNTEVNDTSSFGKYLCVLDCKTEDSYSHITGNEL